MSRAGDIPPVPPSIAAIMAAIRSEVEAPAAAAPADPVTGDPAPPPPAAPAPVTPTARDRDAALRGVVTPLVTAWLDAHLPEIVEAAVHAEIRRLTGQA